MYVCMYLWAVHGPYLKGMTYIHKQTHTYARAFHTHTYTHTYIHTQDMYVCIYLCLLLIPFRSRYFIYGSRRRSSIICNVCMPKHVYVCMYACVCVYTHTYLYIDTRTVLEAAHRSCVMYVCPNMYVYIHIRMRALACV